jgi:hypothetical protein
MALDADDRHNIKNAHLGPQGKDIKSIIDNHNHPGAIVPKTKSSRKDRYDCTGGMREAIGVVEPRGVAKVRYCRRNWEGQTRPYIQSCHWKDG